MAHQIAVALHLGAHKTASTHLQKTLARNEKLLLDNGVRYFGPKYLRDPKHNFQDLFGLRPKGEPIAGRSGSEQITHLAKGERRVVLSEENALGPVFNDQNSGVLYPQADLRLEKFVTAVAPFPVTLFLAVREPSRWIASLYAQRVAGGQLKTFDEFMGGNQLEDLRWSNLVGRLRKVPGLGQIHLWRKEDYPEVSVPVFRRMLGWRIGPLVERIDGRVNEGLSSAALLQIIEWGENGRTGDIRAWVKEARERYILTSPSQNFNPWSDAEHAQSVESFNVDLETIGAWDDVELVKPSGRSRGA
ncbi:MAG: hypothetical protein P8L68_01060 [Paracoccaceae bacterium]|nr:hypothetical protein [Paracoccaceae bacterium]MDG2257071.1 hypothetical protein [Paracoccaceae bacterium]